MCLFFSQLQNTTENCGPSCSRGECQPLVLFGNSLVESAAQRPRMGYLYWHAWWIQQKSKKSLRSRRKRIEHDFLTFMQKPGHDVCPVCEHHHHSAVNWRGKGSFLQ